MNNFITWFFDGLGTEIMSLIIGAVSGGIVGFRIGKHKSKFDQMQEAGDDSEQYQEGNATFKQLTGIKANDTKRTFRQSQKAGNNANQKQIGGHKDV